MIPSDRKKIAIFIADGHSNKSMNDYEKNNEGKTALVHDKVLITWLKSNFLLI